MKTKTNFLKKSLSTAIAVMCAITFATGQTYQTISWDDYAANSNVPYCPCDYIKCAPPEGVSNVEWAPALTMIGDTLVLENGFDGTVTCFYDGGDKYLKLRPLAVPTSPLFPTDTTVCVEFLTLDAGNYNQYGFTSYSWSTSTAGQTISVGPGTYTVEITNICGSVNDETTVIYDNPNAPTLGDDQSFCAGETATLDPHVTNPVSTIWSTGATSNELIVDESGTYSVYVLDNNGCDGRDTIVVTVSISTPEQVCYVEFDIESLRNRINWSLNLPENTVSINIYRETSLDEWTLLGNVDASTFNYVDMGSDPMAQSYSYKISSIDTCGNESELSTYHTTITLLSTYDSGTDTYGFTWSEYQGLSVGNYYLYGINSIAEPTLIGSVLGNQFMYNYVNPDEAYIRYFVAFETPVCGAKENVLVKSNWVTSVLNDVEIQNISDVGIYPNPANETINIITNQTISEITVYSITGQEILKLGNTKTVDVSGLAAGSYSLRIVTETGVVVERVVVE